MSRESSTVANVGIVGISLVITVAMNQLVMIVLARTLGPEDFGYFAVCLVFINLLSYVSMFGLDVAVIHRQTDTGRAIETASIVRFLASIAFSVLLFVSAPMIGDMLGEQNLVLPLRISSIAIVLSALGFEATVGLSKDLRFGSLSLARVANISIWSAVAVTLAYLGFGFWSLLLSYMAGLVVMVIVLWHTRPWKLHYRIDKAIAGELLRYGIFPLGSGLLAFLVWNVDKLAVGAILGSSALLGSYYIAFSYGTIVPNLFTGVTSTVMFPTFSRIQNDLVALSERYLKTLKYISYISIPAGIGLAITSRTFVSEVLGSAWSAAIVPLEIFSIVGVLGSLTSPAASIFLATGNPDKMFRQTWVTSAIYFVFLVPAILLWGLVGVAALFLFGAIVSLVWVLFMVAKILGFSLADELRMLAVPTMASAVMGALTFGVGIVVESTMFGFLVQVVVAVPSYFVCILLMTRGEIIGEARDLIRSARRE